MDESFIPKELVGRDIYQILGLTFDDATKDNIKNLIRKRYLKCALVLHPDKAEGGSKGSGTKENETERSTSTASHSDKFNTLKCAYEFLMNEQLRNKYNQYVSQQKTKIKKHATGSNNLSLNRHLDKTKLDAAQKEKLFFKRKLEARERDMAKGEGKKKWKVNEAEWQQDEMAGDPTASSYRNGKNSRKKKNAQQRRAARMERNHLQNMKTQNEDFVRTHSSVQQSGQTNHHTYVREEGEEAEQRDRVIEIYLNNYPHNVDLLQRCIDQKEFLKFFLDFNFQQYSLNKNEEQTQSERRVGHFSFTHRSEAIRAYLHFKKNGKHIDRNFKLKLAVPCNEGGENDTAAKDNVDRMMNEMDNIKNLIRKRYLKCALVLHPDKAEGGSKGSGTKENETERSTSTASHSDKFNTLKCAYEFLMNEQLRNKYNQYVSQQKTKIKKHATGSNNLSLNRHLDKTKLDAAQKEKLFFKRKLEARERDMAKGEGKKKWKVNEAEWQQDEMAGDPTASSYRNGKNSRKKKNAQQRRAARMERNHLQNMKTQNEDFVRTHSSVQQSGQTNHHTYVREEGEEAEQRDRVIEIYLNNYPHNVDLLQRCIDQKEFLKFFLDFNFQQYSLNKNEEQTQSERRVGHFSFTHRSEAIRAYLHFKKNGKHIDRNFKLKLAVPCNEGGENDTAAKDNVDRMMNEMVNELDKMFSL
ncbi:hypothetical protein AK88_00492 [Plasmodium fragile]|uniref:J domain-containing protein n=1 Tax=Plasmodium fragile TaxID=5857 RepID=A0A0D9QRU4_PLAFR|nr:uncharacterized protein AK88_00492 [Plasmodium fragile]KJP89784.1 hypothetical protein AK88_00492 [Plasmodium fragile]